MSRKRTCHRAFKQYLYHQLRAKAAEKRLRRARQNRRERVWMYVEATTPRLIGAELPNDLEESPIWSKDLV